MPPAATLDPRVNKVILEVSRDAFVASPDTSLMVSGHSIPPTSVVRKILSHLPLLQPEDRVMQVGAGSGYLAAVMARLVSQLVVVERNDMIADIARTNLAQIKTDNVQIILGDGEAGAPDFGPFRVIVASCMLVDVADLMHQLADDGVLVVLEGSDPHVPDLVQYRKSADGFQRTKLGVIDFRTDSGDVLIDLGVVDEEAVARARAEARRQKKPLLSIVRSEVNFQDVNVYRAMAKRLGMGFDEAEHLFGLLELDLFRRFSRTFLDHYRLIPVCFRDKRLVVATDNPDTPIDVLERMHPDAGIERVLVTPTDYRRLWSALNISDRSSNLPSPRLEQQYQPLDSEEDSTDRISPYLVAIYEALLLDAVSEDASDIHIERYNDRVRIRLRVDGELHNLDHYQLTPAEIAGVINVIKTRAELDIAERRLPQGGRSRLRAGDITYDLRIQTQPALHGEHAVIRLLPQRGRALKLSELGMTPHLARHYRRLLDNPAGMVLIVGPTGSGKSTTLSAGLQELADDGRRKVITIEDPIEYAIDNIQQSRVRANIGFNFADAMRSFVRQDPDVILVGEIRDGETALETARASQTGHLVLSTLHCNDAVDAVQRLYDLGLHPNSIASELLAVMAQRLAKRICPNCKTEIEPDPEILAELFPEQVPDGFRCYEGKGCNRCAKRGTKGRVAVVEFMQVNDDIRSSISRHPPVGELRWRALDAGLVTMRDSALDLVIEGVIPLSELPRILPAERMAPEARGGRR